MKRARSTMLTTLLVGVSVVMACHLGARAAHAHCDSMDGPLVREAKAALEKGDVTPILKWVTAEDEAEIRSAFEDTLAVRATGPAAKALADTYFFETLVRVHRAGEGAPYTGLKPPGKIAPTVRAADEAVDAGSVKALASKLAHAAERGAKERFDHLMETQKHKDASVEAGREYVAAYVVFVHYVEALHNAIAAGGEHDHGTTGHREEAGGHGI